MKPARFDYHRPSSIADAVSLLAEAGDEGRVLAGGQSLVPMMNLRLACVGQLVDINGLAELSTIRRDEAGTTIGALVRHQHVVDAPAELVDPLLSRAARLVGHPAIRHRGTVVGSMAHADPAAELPAAALALDATFEIDGPNGPREVAAAEFFLGYWESCLAVGELVTAMRIPARRAPSGSAVRELTRRQGDFAIAGALCRLEAEDNVISRASIALFGMAPTPVVALAAESRIVGRSVDSLDLSALTVLDEENLQPADDVHASSDYRISVCDGLLAAAVESALHDLVHGLRKEETS